MLKALDRNIASASERIVFLAPSAADISPVFRRVASDDAQYSSLVADVQRFRGGIYLKDGAIQPQDLTSDGRHLTEDDTAGTCCFSTSSVGSACALYLKHQSM
jgi:hypothetical protein